MSFSPTAADFDVWFNIPVINYLAGDVGSDKGGSCQVYKAQVSGNHLTSQKSIIL